VSTIDAPMKLGEGRISGVVSVAIGLLSIGAVLCLRFPGWLTTPELRQHYDLPLLRLVLAVAMAAAVCLAFVSFALNRRKHLGAVGLSAVLLAMLLGGPYTPVQEFEQSAAYVGLDWLVLDLFFTGVAFIALERIFPRVIRDARVLREDWRLDLAYFSVNHLLIGVFLLLTTHFAHDAFAWAVNATVQAHVVALPALVRFILVVLAADAVEYATHRAYHEVPFLWRFHAVHHSPQQMDWLSGASTPSITRRSRWTGSPARASMSARCWQRAPWYWCRSSSSASRRTRSSPTSSSSRSRASSSTPISPWISAGCATSW
jgi:hypothetical protein